MPRIGLVAGHGKIPVIFAKAAKAKGDTVIAFGLKGVTGEGLGGYVDKIHWLEWGDFQKAIMLLVRERIKKIALLGKIKKDIVFKGDAKLDESSRNIIEKAKDRKDYHILSEVAKVLGTFGVEIIDPTAYLGECIPSKGTITKRKPTQDELDDIDYGRNIAKELARFDIGQTVAVKDKTVIALEAVEGTNEVIKRAGLLTHSGFVVVKMARPDQDMRFDVPLVGMETLKVMVESCGKVLALEGSKTFLIEKDELVKLADEKGIAIVII